MTVSILQGDCLNVLHTLPDQSVNCCVTSPPYWGLRDYGTAKWEGGSQDCDHKQYLGGHNPEVSPKQLSSQGTQKYNYRDVCSKCGAIRIDDQIGLEQTPDDYVQKLVQVFREVRRVLKDDGTCWLNLGDSYAGSGCGTNDYRTEASRSINKSDVMFSKKPPQQKIIGNDGMKPKDLIGIPWMVAFALRADGWWLRQDIIWHKPNPMPESVKDRCTKAHEYIFLLTKSARYYYDADAIMEESKGEWNSAKGFTENGKRGKNSEYETGRTAGKQFDGAKSHPDMNQFGRNKRSVWTVTTKPYSGAHFATFPPDLIEPCIMAGCPVGGTVLDPFNGSGTTGMVSIKHNRNYIGIELNPEYIALSHKRIEGTQRMLI